MILTKSITKKTILLLLLLFVLPACARVSVALFPLKNQRDHRISDWIGYSMPEIFFRKLSLVSEVQVWDPVFLFSVDTLCWDMTSDSLLMIHKKRWKWDYAIGGTFTADADSVWMTFIIAKQKDNKLFSVKKKIKGDIDRQIYLCSTMLTDILKFLKIEITPTAQNQINEIITDNNSVYATYATGYGYEIHKKIHNAISVYNRVLDMNEMFTPALFRIGMLYSRCRKRKDAGYYVSKAVQRSSDSPLYVSEMAQYLLLSNKLKKALSFINSKRAILEKTAEGMKAIGMAYLMQGEYQRAVSMLTRAVALGPSDLETEFVLGRAYLKLGHFTTAADIFGRLIKYRPYYTRYYSFLGEAYRDAGKLMESSNVLENAMKLDPDNVPNLINLSNTYFKLGWYDKAEQFLLRAIEINDELSEIYINLGVVYWHMKRLSKAEEMFIIASNDKVYSQSAMINQGNMLFLSGNIRQAIKFYKRADKKGKKNEVTLHNLALAYLSIKKTKEAIACFDELLMLSPDRIDVLIRQAELVSSQGMDDNAELYYRKILDISPEHRVTMAKLISLYEKQKRYKEAMQIVEGYLATYPQDREYRIKLPDLYRSMGWYDVAVSEYENLLQDKDYKNDSEIYLGIGKSQRDKIIKKGTKGVERAIYNLKKAIELDINDPQPDLIIASIYMDIKNYKNLAIEHWQQAYRKSNNSDQKQEIADLIAGAKK